MRGGGKKIPGRNRIRVENTREAMSIEEEELNVYVPGVNPTNSYVYLWRPLTAPFHCSFNLLFSFDFSFNLIFSLPLYLPQIYCFMFCRHAAQWE